MAPHVMVEPICVESIAHITETYAQGPLKTGSPAITPTSTTPSSAGRTSGSTPRSAAGRSTTRRARRTPTLLIQGTDDEYGTLAQIDRIEQLAQGPVERLVLDNCGHSPHRDQEAAVLAAVVSFAARLPAHETE